MRDATTGGIRLVEPAVGGGNDTRLVVPQNDGQSTSFGGQGSLLREGARSTVDEGNAARDSRRVVFLQTVNITSPAQRCSASAGRRRSMEQTYNEAAQIGNSNKGRIDDADIAGEFDGLALILDVVDKE